MMRSARRLLPMLALVGLPLSLAWVNSAQGQTTPPPAPATPEPWKTAVRIHMPLANGREIVWGSGTVIQSTADRSLVLTCAHLFRERGGPITVDLFRPEMAVPPGGGPGKLTPLDSHEGRLFLAHYRTDVAMLEIRPGRVLDASPVLPESRAITPGQTLTAVGCGGGEDATVWTTRALGQAKEKGAPFTECEHAPREGRSGGGLFTQEGLLVGVCDFQTGDGTGLYAAPESIHAALAKAGMRAAETGRYQCPPGRVCPVQPSPQRVAGEPQYAAPPPYRPYVQIGAAPPPPEVPGESWAEWLDRHDSRLPPWIPILAGVAFGAYALAGPVPSGRRPARAA